MTEPRPPSPSYDPQLAARLQAALEAQRRAAALVRQAEEQKGETRLEVFTKVLADYQGRLQAANAALAPLREEATRLVAAARQREQEVRPRLEALRQELEEQRFRCKVGEFSPADLAHKERELGAKEQQLAADLAASQQLLGELGRLLGGEAPRPPATAATLAARPPSRPPAPPVDPAPAKVTVAEATWRPAPAPVAEPARPKPPPAPAPVARAALEPPPATPAAPPAATAAPTGLVWRKKSGEVEQFALDRDKLSIGRSTKSDIVLKVAGVSRTHAHLMRSRDGSLAIVDTSGGEGLEINGEKLKKAHLRVGDRITIASVDLEVVAS